MKRLFGTDGIRGFAGEFPLDSKTVQFMGASLARQFRTRLGREPRFITGRDTRESGLLIESAFHAGARASNAVCESAAVITTPGVAYLTGAFEFDAGIVVSASHNPYEDNGIKIFSRTGKKVGEDIERQIENDIRARKEENTVTKPAPPDSGRSAEFRTAYLDHLLTKAKGFSARGKKMVIDCANGASCELGPRLFSALAADMIVINDRPNGKNINDNCGSLHLEHLQKKVLDEKADFGVAFDGDADRALFVDETGSIIDGDATLWIMAQYLQNHGKLANSTVVATLMSNIGLELALKSKGIELLRTDVGD